MLIADEKVSKHVVSKEAIDRLQLEVEKHTSSYFVARADNAVVLVNQRCVMIIRFQKYNENFWCGVFPTNLTDILLGNLWLKERNAYHEEEANSCSFTSKDACNVESL